MTWFGGKYKDDKPENYFAQFATDPDEYFDVAADKIMPADQLLAWKRDRPPPHRLKNKPKMHRGFFHTSMPQ
jgi:hypothetical protein